MGFPPVLLVQDERVGFFRLGATAQISEGQAPTEITVVFAA